MNSYGNSEVVVCWNLFSFEYFCSMLGGENIVCKVENRLQIPIKVRNVLKCKVETRHEDCDLQERTEKVGSCQHQPKTTMNNGRDPKVKQDYLF